MSPLLSYSFYLAWYSLSMSASSSMYITNIKGSRPLPWTILLVNTHSAENLPSTWVTCVGADKNNYPLKQTTSYAILLKTMRRRWHELTGSNLSQMTLLSTSCPVLDVSADTTLSSRVQCAKKLVKMILGLSDEQRQQLLVLFIWCCLRANQFLLSFVDNFICKKVVKNTGILDLQFRHQMLVFFLNRFQMNEPLREIWRKRTPLKLVSAQTTLCSLMKFNY